MTRCLPLIFMTIFVATATRADEANHKKSKQSASDVTILYSGGATLDGWEGREDLWSVENGEIVGRTSDKTPIDANTFLIWKGGQPDNFELVLNFKIESGNSGIQYRSKIIDAEKFIVGGYQADIDFTNRFAGILYEEKGRGILAKRGDNVSIDNEGEKIKKRFGNEMALGNGIHPGQWNEFRVVADGNHVQHFINGTKTIDVTDRQDDKSSSSGVIALQLHKGPAMVVRFKQISLRKLK